MKPHADGELTLVVSDLAQDPRELFDLVRADGSPTGRTKARALVHRDGDWHRALHVWIAGADAAGPFLLFQRRGLGKDTWPGRLDATVGGHLRAGEGLAEALREVEEEVGIAAPGLADVRRLGTRVRVDETEPGWVDRELQEVVLLRDDRPLAAYRPYPAELAALVRFPLPPLLAFLAGEAPTIDGAAIAPGAPRAVEETFAPADFIPSVDRYFYRVAVAAAAALRGERHVAV